MNENHDLVCLKSATAAGVVLMVLGGLAFALPLAAVSDPARSIGAILILSGIVQLAHAFRFHRSYGWASRVLMAALSIAVGMFAVQTPVDGALAISAALAFYFLVAAIGRGALALEFSPIAGRGWLALSSVVCLFLGVYLLSTLAASSLAMPGMFLGADLLVYGVSLIALAFGLRKTDLSIVSESWKKSA